jgi:hypothetical protein
LSAFTRLLLDDKFRGDALESGIHAAENCF